MIKELYVAIWYADGSVSEHNVSGLYNDAMQLFSAAIQNPSVISMGVYTSYKTFRKATKNDQTKLNIH